MTKAKWIVLPQYSDRSVFPIGCEREDGAISILAEVNSCGGTPEHQRRTADLIVNSVNQPKIDCIVALNTLQQFCRADAKGVYFNSPDMNYFDGSATGYWERLAREMGATDDEINHAKTV